MSIGPHFNRWQAYGLAVSIVVVVLATALHNPFGGYVRDDGLYSKIEFLRMFRESFLEYADLSDEDLLAKVTAKYPAFKTWIREATDGSPPMPVAISGQPANYRLQPPPAYYGARPRRYSPHALFLWIAEPTEYAGFVGPVLLATAIWVWVFRNRKSGAT